MLAPVKVINPRVMTEKYPDKDHRQSRKFARKKPKSKPRKEKEKARNHIDITA